MIVITRASALTIQQLRAALRAHAVPAMERSMHVLRYLLRDEAPIFGEDLALLIGDANPQAVLDGVETALSQVNTRLAELAGWESAAELDPVAAIRAEITRLERELSRLSGEVITIWHGSGGESHDVPPGGALLTVEWAVSDQSYCEWYPTLEGAKAALLSLRVRRRSGGISPAQPRGGLRAAGGGLDQPPRQRHWAGRGVLRAGPVRGSRRRGIEGRASPLAPTPGARASGAAAGDHRQGGHGARPVTALDVKEGDRVIPLAVLRQVEQLLKAQEGGGE